MKIGVSLIAQLAGCVAAEDGRHVVLMMRDHSADAVTLALPFDHVPRLIDLCSRAVTDHARANGGGSDPQVAMHVLWWNLTRNTATDGFQLSLTFESGGGLRFAISEHMATALLQTLKGHLENPGVSARPGFVD